MSNVSSPSSLWLDTSWRALSDKMHFPSQTSFLHSGWFLALAANAPNLWHQFYFRFYFCQQCCVLEFDFATHCKKIYRLPFPTLCLPLDIQEQRDARILSHLIPMDSSAWHITCQLEPQMTGLPSLPLATMHFYVLTFTLVVFWWVVLLFCMHREQLGKACFFYE